MKLPQIWNDFLSDFIATQSARDLSLRVATEYARGGVTPRRELLFSAFEYCEPQNVRVVILGQDPYINKNQATGMSFSINPAADCKFPPSLKNIITEIKTEFGKCGVENGDLIPWAKQGVLLLNTCLTTKIGQSLAHVHLGWDIFTRAVLTELNDLGKIVFILWGNNAKNYCEILKNPQNLVLASAHPSPLSASSGFFGNNHFKLCNEFLESKGLTPIAW
jgi:uracil-DNA glycosylase